jgi:hypothetical protein
MGSLEEGVSRNGRRLNQFTEHANLRGEIYQILKESPRPMTPLEIITKLKSQGIDARVKNLRGRVHATLCMYTEFDKVTHGLYAAGKLPGQYRGSTKDEYVARAQRTRPDIFTLDQIAQMTHIPHDFIAQNIELLGTPKPDGTGAYGYTKAAMNKLARRYARSVPAREKHSPRDRQY